MILLLAAAFICSYVKDDPANGLFPESLPSGAHEWWNSVRQNIHRLPCPFCGGTRSFLLMCRGNIVAAAHYSFFGIYFFFLLLIHIPLKYRMLKKSAPLPPIIAAFVRFTDNPWYFIGIATVMMALQLLLHYTGIFEWAVL
jgi:hypothetical protein